MINTRTISNLHVPSVGLRGLGMGADIDFDALFSKGLDVAGSLLARKPSDYVSPNDPRYRAQAPQTVYQVTSANPQPDPTKQPAKTSSGGLQISTNTLIIGGLVLLAFMSGRR